MQILALVAVVLAAQNVVVDRVAVVVGKAVITESEVQEEVRVTQFLNQQPLDLSAEQRRAAAERLVDQQLIRNEMQLGNYPQPDAAETEKTLRTFRQEHFGSPAQFRAALEKYAITEDVLKRHLAWEIAAVRFTDTRFRAAVPPPGNSEDADRVKSEANDANDNGVEQRMEEWLKDVRSQTRIDFKKEAFQ